MNDHCTRGTWKGERMMNEVNCFQSSETAQGYCNEARPNQLCFLQMPNPSIHHSRQVPGALAGLAHGDCSRRVGESSSTVQGECQLWPSTHPSAWDFQPV